MLTVVAAAAAAAVAALVFVVADDVNVDVVVVAAAAAAAVIVAVAIVAAIVVVVSAAVTAAAADDDDEIAVADTATAAAAATAAVAAAAASAAAATAAAAAATANVMTGMVRIRKTTTPANATTQQIHIFLATYHSDLCRSKCNKLQSMPDVPLICCTVLAQPANVAKIPNCARRNFRHTFNAPNCASSGASVSRRRSAVV